MKKRLKNIAGQIVQLEAMVLNKDEKEIQMNDLIRNLSVEELMEIDDYIMKNHLLKN